MKKRIVLILVACIMVISALPLTTFAAVADPITPMFDNTNTFNANLSFNGSTGNVTMTIMGKSGVSNITAEIKLYYKNSTGSWIEIDKGWDYNVNQMYLTVIESFSGVAGREYKIEVSATLTKNGVAENISTTSTARCPSTP